jgi:hypothetical protein
MKAIKAVLGFVWDVVSFFIELLKFIAGAAKEINQDLTRVNKEAGAALDAAILAREQAENKAALDEIALFIKKSNEECDAIMNRDALRISKPYMSHPYGRK